MYRTEGGFHFVEKWKTRRKETKNCGLVETVLSMVEVRECSKMGHARTVHPELRSSWDFDRREWPFVSLITDR